MSLSVRARAQTLATFRSLEVRLMEMLARWVPSTPEMEVKVLFGQHIWDHAQHADALGKRVHELRAPLHHTLEPAPAWLDLLAALNDITGTRERLHACYGIVLPGLESRYEAYLAATDALVDAPSVRIVTDILHDLSRMKTEHQALLDQLPDLAPQAGGNSPLARLAASAGDPVLPEPAVTGNHGPHATPASEEPHSLGPAAARRNPA